MLPENKSYKLEACVTSLEQAIASENHGANRIEICQHLETGGMTPDFNLVDQLCHLLIVPIRVMIRNTSEGFEADDATLEAMIKSIEQFKALPIEGFVIGVLKNGVVDRDAMKKIFIHSFPLPITFHKAIDESLSIVEDINWLNEFEEVDTILTSGGAPNAFEGVKNILALKSIFKRTIMAGGKIIPEHLDDLNNKLGLDWYHGRSIVGDLGK